MLHRAVGVLCAGSLWLAAAAPAVGGGLPKAPLDKAQRGVGQAISRVSAELPVLPTAPLTREPSRPAPRPARAAAPAAPQGSAAAPEAAAPAQAARPATPVRASSGRASAAPSAAAPRAHASAAKAKVASASKAPADPTDATPAASRPVATTAAGGDSGSLPFTGSTVLPLLLTAVLILMAGTGLRRATRPRS